MSRKPYPKAPCPLCGGPMTPGYPRCASCRGYGRGWYIGAGYVHIFRPDHPMARANGYVLEHRAVLHEAGVDIPDGFHVHHRNGDKADNRLENLEVVSPADHARRHLEPVGVVTNQYGTFPVLFDEEARRQRRNSHARKYDAQRRARST